jgi:hypothetical protein
MDLEERLQRGYDSLVIGQADLRLIVSEPTSSKRKWCIYVGRSSPVIEDMHV